MKTFYKTVEQMRKEGRPLQQAIAIGYSHLRRECGVPPDYKPGKLTPSQIIAAGKGKKESTMPVGIKDFKIDENLEQKMLLNPLVRIVWTGEDTFSKGVVRAQDGRFWSEIVDAENELIEADMFGSLQEAVKAVEKWASGKEFKMIPQLFEDNIEDIEEDESMEEEEKVYPGVLGLLELDKFYRQANNEEIAEWEELLRQNRLGEAIKVVERVLGVRFSPQLTSGIMEFLKESQPEEVASGSGVVTPRDIGQAVQEIIEGERGDDIKLELIETGRDKEGYYAVVEMGNNERRKYWFTASGQIERFKRMIEEGSVRAAEEFLNRVAIDWESVNVEKDSKAKVSFETQRRSNMPTKDMFEQKEDVLAVKEVHPLGGDAWVVTFEPTEVDKILMGGEGEVFQVRAKNREEAIRIAKQRYRQKLHGFRPKGRRESISTESKNEVKMLPEIQLIEAARRILKKIERR